MSRTLSRLSLTSALLTPLVTLDWSEPRRRGATVQARAVIGTLSDVMIQSVDPEGDPADPACGLSVWSRARGEGQDPFPVRLWGLTQQIDGAGWQQAKRVVHQRLLMMAQSQVLLSGKPLAGVLDGLRLVDVEAAQRVVALISGRETAAESLGALLTELHAAA